MPTDPAHPDTAGLLRKLLEMLPTVPGDYSEVLGDKGRGPFVSRAAVLAALAATEAAEIDVETLARAMVTSQLIPRFRYYAEKLPDMKRSTDRVLALEWAPRVAAEYTRLRDARSTPEEEPSSPVLRARLAFDALVQQFGSKGALEAIAAVRAALADARSTPEPTP